jgi:hypothetical protein
MAEPYASVEELKLWLAGRAPGSDTDLAMDASEDELLADVLSAASRSIDRRCGYPARRFWLDSTASARIFTPRGRTVRTDDGELLIVDDIGATEDLTVAVGRAGTFTVLDSSEFEAKPDNATANEQAITGLLRVGSVWSSDPRVRVKVTAKWGWPAVPSEVKQATLILASRLYKRRQSPEGILGNADWGGMTNLAREDPDVRTLLKDFVLDGF